MGVLRDRLDEPPRAERLVLVAAAPLVHVPAEVDQPRRRAGQVVDLLDRALADVSDPEVLRLAVEAEAPRVPEPERDDLRTSGSRAGRRGGASCRAGCPGSGPGSRDRRPSLRRPSRPRASRRARRRGSRRCGSRTAGRSGGSAARSAAGLGRCATGSGRPSSTRPAARCSSRRRCGRARRTARTRARAGPAHPRRATSERTSRNAPGFTLPRSTTRILPGCSTT